MGSHIGRFYNARSSTSHSESLMQLSCLIKHTQINVQFILVLQGHVKKNPVTNPLLKPPNELNYRLVYNEESLHQRLAWK